MRIIVCTSNSQRHRWVANLLARAADESLIIAECCPSDEEFTRDSALNRHRAERFSTESRTFIDSDSFHTRTLAVERGEINMPSVVRTVQAFQPNAVFVFGTSIIREPLISIMPRNRTINMHLGLSPYYRGAATNFWPFINDELQFVGATILHLDPGIDTGDIICHVRPALQATDNVHTAGCRVITEGATTLVRIMSMIRQGKTLPRTIQWRTETSRYYRISDVDEVVMQKYRENMARGIVRRYVESPPLAPHLIDLP